MDEASKVEINFLASVAAIVPTGPIISVCRPNSPFSAMLSLIGWPARDILRHAPITSLRPSMLGTPKMPGRALLGGQYQKQIVSNVTERVIDSAGDIISIQMLDKIYGNLINCSAVEINMDTEAYNVLKGAKLIFEELKPICIISGGRDDLINWQKFISFFDHFNYVAFDAQLSLLGPDRLPWSPLVVAMPISTAWSIDSWRGALAGRPSPAGPIDISRRLAALARKDFDDPLEGWSDTIGLEELQMTNSHSCEYVDGRLMKWTGPERSTHFLIYAPSAGRYRISVCVADSGFPPELGLGALRHKKDAGDQMRWEIGNRHYLDVQTAVSKREASAGVLVSHIVPEIGFRGGVKVGIKFDSVHIARIANASGENYVG